jgi:hypothetical protein
MKGNMRKACLLSILLLFASVSFAENGSVVRWRTVLGVITAPGVSNAVAGIASGGQPWTTTRGEAVVNLSSGEAEFSVEGLVLNGGNATGTRATVAAVKGTLVCNAGTATQAVLDGATVPLSLEGDARFKGNLGNVPSPCANPLFLIRLGAAAPGDRWIATGAVRVGGD